MWIVHLCIVLAGINIFYWIILYSSIAWSTKKKGLYGQINKPASVIICAKNEADNLARNLPQILTQKYPQFEVIVIDDHSEDRTAGILEDLARQYSRLRYYRMTGVPGHGKKRPLKEGILRASNEILILTDADCRPSSPHWLLQMATGSHKKSFTLGYGAYEKRPGILNVIIRFETVMTAIQYFSYAMAGMPYMGVGRNLSYKKSEFLKTDQFLKHNDLLSGDDDIHVNQYANGSNTSVVFHPDAFTISKAADKLGQYLKQKKRHYSTAKRYRTRTKLLLGLHQLSFVGFYLSMPVVLFFFFSIGWKIYLLRLLLVWVLFALWSNALKERDLILSFPLTEAILAGLFLFLSPSLMRKSNEW